MGLRVLKIERFYWELLENLVKTARWKMGMGLGSFQQLLPKVSILKLQGRSLLDNPGLKLYLPSPRGKQAQLQVLGYTRITEITSAKSLKKCQKLHYSKPKKR
ncbi:MAG: hypothetical protein BRC44_10950 [Cyanobacteria bacterium QS_4_48_99]|nr:MAG: hypothetical protein BRC44_10950 [Cyanobacteria bacterium QS_4_48_99]